MARPRKSSSGISAKTSFALTPEVRALLDGWMTTLSIPSRSQAIEWGVYTLAYVLEEIRQMDEATLQRMFAEESRPKGASVAQQIAQLATGSLWRGLHPLGRAVAAAEEPPAPRGSKPPRK